MSDISHELQYLTFSLSGEEYAIGILEVIEIIEFSELTRIPQTHSFVRGVMNLRGSVVPVLDLSVKFGLSESRPTKWTCIIIIEITWQEERTKIGVMADVVNRVISLSPDEIEAPPSYGTNLSANYLVGMGKAGKKFILILDMAKILSTDEILSLSSFYHSDHSDNESKTLS